MQYATIFDLIAAEFQKAGITYLLIGGFAVNAYKVTRFTLDVDFLMAEEDREKAASILEQAGFRERTHHQNFSGWGENPRYPTKVDLLFTDRQTLQAVWDQGKAVKIAGCELKVPSLEHLIAMKLHAIKQQPERREWKDWMDIIQLIKIHQVDTKSETFRKLCLKFGTADLYQRIRGHETQEKKK